MMRHSTRYQDGGYAAWCGARQQPSCAGEQINAPSGSVQGVVKGGRQSAKHTLRCVLDAYKLQGLGLGGPCRGQIPRTSRGEDLPALGRGGVRDGAPEAAGRVKLGSGGLFHAKPTKP